MEENAATSTASIMNKMMMSRTTRKSPTKLPKLGDTTKLSQVKRLSSKKNFSDTSTRFVDKASRISREDDLKDFISAID